MSYIRITANRIRYEDNNGDPAVGYKVYTCDAGTTTDAATYSDRALSVLNANPIVLDSRGEAQIFVSTAIKLIFCLPTSTGKADGVISTDDYLGEQQGTVNETGAAGVAGGAAAFANNVYSVDTVPPYAAIPDMLTLVMVPDATNFDTIEYPDKATAQVFTGTGIDDLTWDGPYLGSVAATVFEVTIDAVYLQPPAAPTAANSAVAGSVTAGVHYVKITFVTAEGETTPGNPSGAVTAGGTKKIDVSAIPVGPTGTTARKVYMTEAAGSDYYLVDTIANNTATTYAINIDDATLAGNAAAPSSNTTGDAAGSDTFMWRVDAGAYTTDVAITTAAQTLQNNIKVTFAEYSGHTLGDSWTLTVMTPTKLNFCSLGEALTYKIVDGAQQASDGGDFIQNYPACLIWSQTLGIWIHTNPSLPVFEESTPQRIRKEIFGNYTVTEADWGQEISCNADCTIAFPALSTLPHEFFYIHPGPWTVTITTVAAASDLIYPPFTATGVTSYVLYIGGPGTVQLGNNGASLHVLTQVAPSNNYIKFTKFLTPGTATWTKTAGYNWAEVIVVGGGGGGGGDNGGGGGAGGRVIETIDITAITSETVTVGAGGTAGGSGSAGNTGGTSSFGSHCSATGGAGGAPSGGTGVGGAGGAGADGDINITGEPGSNLFIADGAVSTPGRGGSGPYGGGGNLIDATGYGAGGGGAGGDGTGGLVIVKEYR